MSTNRKRSSKQPEPAPQEKSRPTLMQDLLVESLRVSDQEILGLAAEVLMGVGAKAIAHLALAAQDPTTEASHRAHLESVLARLRSDKPPEPTDVVPEPNRRRLEVKLLFEALRVEDEKLNRLAGDLLAGMGEEAYQRLIVVTMDLRNGLAHRVWAMQVGARIPAPEGWQPGNDLPHFDAALKAGGWQGLPKERKKR